MTRFPLRRLRLRPGEEQRDVVPIELEPFELGGQRYLPVPHEVEGDLTVAQATTGLDLRLAFDVRLHGPCMRCLEDAVQDVHIDAREYHANEPGDSEELRSEYVVDDQLELSAWARDAIALALPGPDPARARLPGAVSGLRQGSERRAAHARRGRAGLALVGPRRATRPAVATRPLRTRPGSDPVVSVTVTPVLAFLPATAGFCRRGRDLSGSDPWHVPTRRVGWSWRFGALP